MEKAIGEALSEWFAKELPELVERDLDVPIKGDQVVILVGPRRAGKTYLLFQETERLLNEGYERRNIAYLDFEDLRLSRLRPEDFSAFTKSISEHLREREGKIVLLLDEIQRLDGWESWVRTLHNSGRYRIAVTGSSSRLSTAEVATQLRGRYIPRLVLPFSFREFLRTKREITDPTAIVTPEDRGRILRLLREYLKWGGFPDVVKAEGEERKAELLRVYRDTIFYRDVVERFRVRDVSALDSFSRMLGESFGKAFSISKAEKAFRSMGVKKSKRTLSEYLRYFESAFFVFTVEKVGYKARERALQPRKVYPVDPGIYGIYTRFSEDLGVVMECAVAVELLRRGYAGVGKLFYWRDYAGREVDFVVRRGVRVEELIQVTYASGSDEIMERELEALARAARELGCKKATVITWDYEEGEEGGEEEGKGAVAVEYRLTAEKEKEGPGTGAGRSSMRFVPLWKWLLQPDGVHGKAE
ncbi:MAG: ATP-binding protein [Candidatus Verstraetearchaeota archaeon]|nr:ATP-binding protein [Candidatus Verstraetearchaeota archaeon]